MTSIYNWITANWQAVLAVVALAITLAGRIVDLTPTDVDNKFLEKVIAALKVVGLKVGAADPAKKE